MSGPVDAGGSYRIGEVSGRTGLAATTLRYYEEIGVVPPAARDASGYRRYDERDVARLHLVARARGLGVSLDGIAVLVATWDDHGCTEVSDALRAVIDDEITATDARIRSDQARVRALVDTAASLPSEPAGGPCSDSCGCLGSDQADRVGQLGQDGDAPIACTLEPGRRGERVADWSAVLDHVAFRELHGDGLRLVFDSDAVLPEVTRLATAERSCCGFFDFVVTLDARGPALEVSAPPEAREIVDALFTSGVARHTRSRSHT